MQLLMKQFLAKSQHSKVEAAQASIPKNVEECQSHVNTLDTMNKYLFPLNLKRWHNCANESKELHEEVQGNAS